MSWWTTTIKQFFGQDFIFFTILRNVQGVKIENLWDYICECLVWQNYEIQKNVCMSDPMIYYLYCFIYICMRVNSNNTYSETQINNSHYFLSYQIIFFDFLSDFSFIFKPKKYTLSHTQAQTNIRIALFSQCIYHNFRRKFDPYVLWSHIVLYWFIPIDSYHSYEMKIIKNYGCCYCKRGRL